VRSNKVFFTHLRNGVLRQSSKLNSLTSKIKKNVTAYCFTEGKTLNSKILEVIELAVTYTPHYINSFCYDNLGSSNNCDFYQISNK
jgi:hypothetical protein